MTMQMKMLASNHAEPARQGETAPRTVASDEVHPLPTQKYISTEAQAIAALPHAAGRQPPGEARGELTVTHQDPTGANNVGATMPFGHHGFEPAMTMASAAMPSVSSSSLAGSHTRTSVDKNPTTASAFAIWTFVCELQQKSSSDDRAEIYCVLFDAADVNGSGVISRAKLKDSIVQLGTDKVSESLIQGHEHSSQLESEDFGARVLLGSPMGRLHIVCRCLCLALDAGMLAGRDNVQLRVNEMINAFGQSKGSLLYKIAEIHGSQDSFDWNQFCAMVEEVFIPGPCRGC